MKEKSRLLDLVPLACAGREVADVDHEAELVGHPLKLVLPDVRAIAVAAARVRPWMKISLGVPVALRHADLRPPRFDRRDRNRPSVVIDADADEPVVGADVMARTHHMEWPCPRHRWRQYCSSNSGLAFRVAIRAHLFLGVPDLQPPLFSVDGEHGDAAFDAFLGLRVDVFELESRRSGCCVPSNGLARCLQAVTVLFEQLRDRLVAHADAMYRANISLRQGLGARACPAQRGFRIACLESLGRPASPVATRRRMLDFECHGDRHLLRPTNTDGVLRANFARTSLTSLAYRADRQPGRTRDGRHASPSPTASAALAHKRRAALAHRDL